MSAYRKGYEAEREVINLFATRFNCFDYIRSAGSYTPIDVLCGNGDKVYAIQVKRGNQSLSKLSKERFRDYARSFNAIPVIARKIPYHGWTFEYVTGTKSL